MIEAIFNKKQCQVWVAYTFDELARLARATAEAPIEVPILLHPWPAARLRIMTTQLEMQGAGDVFWWDVPEARRIASPQAGVLYVILDTVRYRGLCQIDKAMARGVRFLSNPIRTAADRLDGRGNLILWTAYDEAWDRGKVQEMDKRMADALVKFRQDRAEAKNPKLKDVKLNWTPLTGVHDGVSAREKVG